MKRYLFPLLAAALAAAGTLMPAARAGAHHAVTPFYDLSKTIEFDGIVTRWVFKNPHSFLYLEVTDEKGQKTEWEVELGAPIILAKQGWTPDTVKIGETIHAKGSPSRAPGTHGLSSMAGGTLTRADGSRLVPESGDGPFGGRGGGRGR
jgi:hypothetical protein